MTFELFVIYFIMIIFYYMGVKNFIKFIEKYAPNAINYKKIDTYHDTFIGIDANLLIYKLIFGIRARGYDIINDGMVVTHIHALLLKFLGFLKYRITPIFVFDNVAPLIKSKTIKKRKDAKKKMITKHRFSKSKEGIRKHYYMSTDVTQKEIDDCVKLIMIFGFNVIYAKEESDSQLVNLYENGVIDYIVSDDMDILLFGGTKMLKKFSVDPNKYIQEIDLNIILTEANINMDQLIRIGLLHGTDYCQNKNISSIKAYNIVIANHDNIKNECQEAYQYFIECPCYNIERSDLIYDTLLDKKSLKKFIIKFGFKKGYIKNLFDDIKNKNLFKILKHYNQYNQ